MLPPNVDPRIKTEPTTTRLGQEQLSALTEDQIYSLISIADKHPWIPPDQQMMLAKTNATDRALELVSEMHLRRSIDAEAARRQPEATLQQAEKKKGFWGGFVEDWKKGWSALIPDTGITKEEFNTASERVDPGGVFRGSARWGIAGMQWFPEMAQNYLARDWKDDSLENDIFQATTFNVMLDNLSAGKADTGWLPDQATSEELGRRAREYRGVIEGTDTARSIGRLGANALFDPGTVPYNMISGLIDAAVLLAADPTNYLGTFGKNGAVGLVKGADEVAVMTAVKLAAGEDLSGLTSRVLLGSQAANIVPLQTVEEVKRISAAIKMNAEVTQTLAEVWTPTRFSEFVARHPRMQELVSRLVDLKSPLQVLEDGLRGLPVPNETLVALAKADTPEKVEAILSTLWTIDRFAFPRDARQVARGVVRSKIGSFVTERLPFVNSIKQSRYFTTMPKSLMIVNGDNVLDDIQATRNIVNYLRTMSMPADEVEKIGNQMIEAFSTLGTPTARRKAIDTATNAMRAVFRADGHPDESFDFLMRLNEYATNQIKSYLTGRDGLPVDGKWADWFRSQNLPFLDRAGKKALVDDIASLERRYAITGPVELAHMLDRVIILPPARELRRLTRNSFFRRLLQDVPKDFQIGPGMRGWKPGTKNAFFSRRVTMMVADRDAYEALTKEIEDLIRLRTSTGTVANDARIADLIEQRAALPLRPERVMTGQPRAAFQVMEYIQNGVWKGLALATGGFFVRNSIDTQFRMFLDGYASLRHPYEYIQLVMGMSKKMNLKLDELVNPIVKTKPGEIVDAAQRVANNRKWIDDIAEDYKMALGYDRNYAGIPDAIQQHMYATNEWPKVSRMNDGIELHTDAVVLHGNRTVNADVLRRMAIQSKFEGMPDNFIINKIVAFLNSGSDEANDVRKVISDLLAKGLPVTGKQGGRFATTPPVFLDAMPKDVADEWLKSYARSIVMTSADIFTGKLPEAQFMYAFGYVPYNDGSRMVGAVSMLDDQFDGLGSAARNAAGAEVKDAAELKIGSLVSFREPPDPAAYATARLNAGEAPEIGVIVAVEDVPSGGVTLLGDPVYVKQYRIQPVYTEAAFATRTGSTRARALIKQMPIYEKADGVLAKGLPPQITWERTGVDHMPRGRLDSLYDAYDKLTDYVFSNLYQRWTVKFERSPVWRQAYFQAVYENIGRLSREEFTKYFDDLYNRVGRTEYLRTLRQQADDLPAGPLKDELDLIHAALVKSDPTKFSDAVAIEYASSSAEAGPLLNRLLKDVDRLFVDYVGDERIILDMRRAEDLSFDGTATLDELNDYAAWRGLEAVKQTLYDASERMNVEDILRVIAPFAPAWREIVTQYLGYLRTNPLYLPRSVQRVYTGAVNADPDGDGRGLFYPDPQTGQMMFAVPGSGQLVEALTGVNAPLEAPVKRFSQGLNWLPSLGPLAQVGFSQIVSSLPKEEDLMRLFLPYGAKEVDSSLFMPGWFTKTWQAIKADEKQYGTVYSNTLMEVKRALAASGDYDLSNRDDVNQLEQDSIAKAQIITFMRAVTQFTGPTALSPEYIVKTKKGDVYVSELSRIFYEMQEDPEIGYDNAVQEFLRVFGDDAAIYMSSKTRSLVEGLEPTREFQDWVDDNEQLVKDYTNKGQSVAYYLAPGGSDFVFNVWMLQVMENKRVYQDFPAQVEQMQNKIGAALYADMRRTIGPSPSEDQREQLRDYRKSLHEEYPGFPENAEFTVGAFYNDVVDLKELVADERVADNEIAQAVGEYLTARDEAIEASGVTERGFRDAKSAAEGRKMLYALALSLIETTPEFARIFDRLLASEIEE
jgi:hypothetical protein